MLRRLLRARQKVAGVGQKPPRPLQDREIVVRDLARLELSKIPELRQYVDRLPHLKPQRVNLARHQKQTKMPRRGVPQTAHDALRRLLLAKIQRRLRKKCLPVHIVHIVCENFAGACAHPFEIAVMTKTRGRPQPFFLIRRFRRAQFFVHIVLRRSRVIYFYIITKFSARGKFPLCPAKFARKFCCNSPTFAL